MKTPTIKKIIKKYGSQKKAAEILGITERHVRGIIAGKHRPGKPLQKLMEMILKYY